ncbi:MAG: TrkH family potassium uptake protein, partial [Clostridia bacterium]|nr:TrkH family potassium uptake protein [Clostridia bacterium]
FRPGALFILTLLMFIGASPGGTGGGVKTTTVAVVLASVWATITGRGEPDAFGRRIGREVVDRALAVSVISFLLVVVMTLALLAAEDVLFLQALFEVVSAFGTVGLSTGITSDLSPVGRLIIIATMYAGRVGPLTLAAAIAHVQARQRAFRYPEEKVMVG